MCYYIVQLINIVPWHSEKMAVCLFYYAQGMSSENITLDMTRSLPQLE